MTALSRAALAWSTAGIVGQPLVTRAELLRAAELAAESDLALMRSQPQPYPPHAQTHPTLRALGRNPLDAAPRPKEQG